MRITIDTQHDTYDDIKKVLHILSGIIDQKGLVRYTLDDPKMSIQNQTLISELSKI